MTAPGIKVLELLNSKGGINKDTTDSAFRVFSKIKILLQQYEKLLRENSTVDKRLKFHFSDRGIFEAELKVADDILIFIMHTNAFTFENSNPLWKTGYLSGDKSRGTCGMISVYNFLSDSFKFDRKNDFGQLVARIFVNREEHLLVEGKKQLGILYNDFSSTLANEETLHSIIESCLIYSLEMDAIVPAFEMMKEISVSDAIAYNMQSAFSVRRLGFTFQNETEE